MLIQQMLKEQELKMQETLKKENKSFKEIFDVLYYYVFNSNRIENKEEMYKNINKLCFKLLTSIDSLREEMFESCPKDSYNHEYMDMLDLLIRFLPKEADIETLTTVKHILEEDFDPTYDL